MRTWTQLMDSKTENSEEERVILQLVCAISTEGRYRELTPDQIFQEFAGRSNEIFAGEPALDRMERAGL